MHYPSKSSRRETIWWLSSLSLCFLGLLRIINLGQGTTFFFDEWNFLLDRNQVTISNLLQNHNGHLSVIPVAIYQFLLKSFGAGTYFPYRLMTAMLNSAIALVVGLVVRRRSADIYALCAVALIAFMGAGWQNWLWAFQIGMMLSVLSGLSAVLLVGRAAGKSHERLIVALLVVSVCSSGVGIAVLFGVALAALAEGRKSLLLRSLLVFLGYGVWSLKYGESQVKLNNLSLLPSYVAQSAEAVFGGIGGWTLAIGGVLAGMTVVFSVRSLRSRAGRSPEAIALASICLCGWILSGLSRAQFGEPGASRYVHVGICWIVPLIGLLLGTETRRSRPTQILAIIAVLVAIVGSWDIATRAGHEFRERSTIVRAELTALSHIRSSVDVSYQPDPVRAPQITFGRFQKFAIHHDVPVLSVDKLSDLAVGVRQEIDRVFVDKSQAGLTEARRPATWVCSTEDQNYEEKMTSGSRIWFSGVHSVEVRRYGAQSISLVPVVPGASSELNLGLDDIPRAWRIKFISAGPIELCRPR